MSNFKLFTLVALALFGIYAVAWGIEMVVTAMPFWLSAIVYFVGFISLTTVLLKTVLKNMKGN